MGYTPLSVIIAASAGSIQSTQTTLSNTSGSSIAALTPVRIDSNGKIQLIDVSTEISALSVVGVTQTPIANNSSGNVITQGRILDVTTSFTAGDYIYVSKTGTLTNVLPTNGLNGFVDGDFIIRIGVVAKNEIDINKKDLFISLSITGQM
jgi:hypothetical protein